MWLWALNEAAGVTTRPPRLSLIPPPTFFRWLAHAAFREPVPGLHAERMAELVLLIDAVAFQRLDQRLAGALPGHKRDITTTHQARSEELDTVREIVTRLLRRLEREGWMSLSRERIHIVDSPALRACANGLATDVRHVTWVTDTSRAKASNGQVGCRRTKLGMGVHHVQNK